MRAFLAILALFSVGAHHSDCRTVNLVLPHALRPGEIATLLVTVGVIPRSGEIDITTSSGRELGTISPYGIRAGHESGTYAVPLPAGAISGRRVSLLLSLRANGKTSAPTVRQVKRVSVRIRGAD
ncbi:MAG TPA: hypothetical protein VHX14_03730 [Thermoanaerobaculia bacterium]|jgi:hypothetical protein|nr:hypothetical protein [Thermoanaerobaculia bacterium]